MSNTPWTDPSFLSSWGQDMLDNAVAISGLVGALLTAAGSFAVSMYRIGRLEDQQKEIRVHTDELRETITELRSDISKITSSIHAASEDMRWIRDRLE